MHIPCKITECRQSSLPLGVYVKGIAPHFNWLKCLGGIMHLKPTTRCQISTLIFEEKLWRGVSINIPWKIYQGRHSSCSLWAYIKGIANICNSLKCLGGILHLKPTTKLWSGVSINIPWKIYQGRESSCPLWAYVKGIALAFNWLKCLCGIMHLKPTAGCQISTLIFENKLWRGGLYKYPMKNISRTAKFLSTFR